MLLPLKRLYCGNRTRSAYADFASSDVRLIWTRSAGADSTNLVVLCHLLTSNHLTEVLVQLLFENDLRLATVDNYLVEHITVFLSTLNALADEDLLGLPTLALLTFAVCCIVELLEEQKLVIFCHPLVLKLDSLGGQACDTFQRLTIGAFIATIDMMASHDSISTFTLFLTILSRLIVLELLLQHQTRHLHTFETIERGIRLIVVLFFLRALIFLSASFCSMVFR